MKKVLLTLAIILFAVAAQAQIKLFDDGHVSLGCLTHAYGVQVQPNGYTYFRTQSNAEWSWGTLSYANDSLQKHWIVANLDDPNPGTHTFFVTGNGYVYKRGNWRHPEGSVLGNVSGAGMVLDQITGVWYVPDDGGGKGSVKSEEGRHPGVNPQEVKEVLPEAVTADETGLLYVDYDALTVFLIEAVKEQRSEMELLRKTLEENGLLEPEKP
jgi:hypothetical protein